MKHFSIRHQLAIIVGLSLLPVLLLGYLFVNQSNKEIGFAQKEDDGVAYIEAMLPDFAALAGGEALAPSNSALDAARRLYDAEMGSAELATAYLEARDKDAVMARAAVSKLIAKVGDTSNLILDPDLDSYYVMDILLLKLPAAFNAAADLAAAFEASAGQTENTQDIQVDLLSRIRMFGDLIEGTNGSLASAMAGNPDGGVKTALVPAFEDYRKVADAYAASAKTALAAFAADPTAAELGAVRATEQTFAKAALGFSAAVGTEMSRLLGKRVDGFESRLWTLLAVSAGLVLLVFGYSVFAANSIIRGLNRLETNIRQIAEGTGDEEVCCADGTDEVSAISRAVAFLRECTVARQKALNDSKLSEQARADEERRLAEAERRKETEEKAVLADQQSRVVMTLKEALVRLSGGDLGSSIEKAFPGNLDEIRLAFNQTVESFADVVGRIRTTSHGVKTATGEILAGANDLSERTTKQAATIEETSAAMEQLAHTVNDHAGKAESAVTKTVAASEMAKAGGAVMSEANAAMDRITSSSAKISNIIGMIDDIAFQTNLLALNASVEAARAGEAGKGFAVVAVEVRRLAQSAAQASSEVKVLIEQSAGEVSGGTKLVAEAAQSLSSLLATVEEFSALMREIAKDSQEQASAIREVNIAVRQMDEMTQHNAALVEETNAAIEQTESQASELDRIVEVFTLAERAGGGPGARAQRA